MNVFGPAILASKQLIYNKIRLLVAIAGIAFAVILMLVQIGFKDALLESAAAFHACFHADLVMTSHKYKHLKSTRGFPRRSLMQALGYEGVGSVAPFYIGMGQWKNPWDYWIEGIFIIGLDPTRLTLEVPEIMQQADLLKKPDVVLFDLASQKKYGPVPDEIRAGRAVRVEIGNRKVMVEGLFRTKKTFHADGNLVTSDQNFLRLFPGRKQGVIDIGLIKLAPGADREAVRRKLQQDFAGILTILTREEAVQQEKDYWDKYTPIGFIFNLGAYMGFFVGVIIVYQILFSDVYDHLPEYATLKAMGYSDGYLFMVVVYEAVILAVVGFLPGLLASSMLYDFTARATALYMVITPHRTRQILLATIVMCIISGAIALRKVKSADPADIF